MLRSKSKKSYFSSKVCERKDSLAEIFVSGSGRYSYAHTLSGANHFFRSTSGNNKRMKSESWANFKEEGLFDRTYR